MSKLDRFTKNARHALQAAQTEAQRVNHNYIGTEHLLLALLTFGGSTVRLALFDTGVTESSVRKKFLSQVGKSERKTFGPPVLSPRVKEVITLGVNAAKQLGHEYIDTGHLMLGILEEGNGMGFALLKQTLEGEEGGFRIHFQPKLPIDISIVEERLMERLKGEILPPDPSSESLRKPNIDPVGLSKRQEIFDHLSRQEDLISGKTSLKRQVKWASKRAAQEERNRIARDLHDSIKQQLFNINVSAAAAQERWDSDTDGAKAALADAQESAQAAMVEMNALLMQLNPEPLEKTGLIEALREQCQALAFRTGAQVNTAFGDLPPDEFLPGGTQLALFRIAQEALANIARHARANNVRLRLDSLWDQQAVILEINDNGQGFEPGKILNGMGLTNMKERTEHLNGTVDIVSQPDAGTTVTVTIPFLLVEAADQDDSDQGEPE